VPAHVDLCHLASGRAAGVGHVERQPEGGARREIRNRQIRNLQIRNVAVVPGEPQQLGARPRLLAAFFLAGKFRVSRTHLGGAVSLLLGVVSV
jgi:hypothetical protein